MSFVIIETNDMTMEQAMITIAILTFFGVIAFIFLYLTTENKKKTAKEAALTELKELMKTEVNKLLNQVQEKIQENTNQVTEKFEPLARDVRNAQDQVNGKIDSVFEQLQSENLALRNDMGEKITDIKTSFKDYSDIVKETLNRYSRDNAEFKKAAEHINEQIQGELKKILNEIKAPLDLD